MFVCLFLRYSFFFGFTYLNVCNRADYRNRLFYSFSSEKKKNKTLQFYTKGHAGISPLNAEMNAVHLIKKGDFSKGT